MGGKKGFSKSAKALPRSKSPGGKKGKRKAESATPTPKQVEPDLLGPAAMTNAYYIAHGVQEFLEIRGFAWPDGSKKKKKGGKGKKKKK